MRRVNRVFAVMMACFLIVSLVSAAPYYALAEDEVPQAPFIDETPLQDEPTPEGPAMENTVPEDPLPDVVETPAEGSNRQQTEQNTPFAVTYAVRFFNWDETQLGKTQHIEEGEAAIAPALPPREGFRFTGWSADFSNVTQDMDISAQYVELDSYTITINYIFSNSTIALQPVIYSVAEGESFIRTIDSPSIAGYSPDKASLPITIADVQRNYEYTVIYTPAEDTAYKIEHYKQNLADPENYTLEETENLTGTTAALVTAAAKTYTGFSPPKKMPSAQIAANGSTVLRVYYTRNQYAVYFDSAGGSYVEPVSAFYQEAITAPDDPTRAGYTFTGWSSPGVPATMPAQDVNLTAGWTASGNATVTYVYWLENINSTGYDYVDTYVTSAAVDSAPAIPATVPGGVAFPIGSTYYTFNSTKTNGEKPTTVRGDGTTIVNMYYERRSYTLTFTFGSKYQLTVGGTTYSNQYQFTAKYGAPISDRWPGTPTLISGQTSDGTFVGWTGGSINYVTKQYNLASNLITSNPFAATWDRSSKNVRVNYYFQNIGDSGYTLGDTQTVAVQSSSTTWNAKTFVGFTAENATATITNGTANFYYKRIQYSITYYNGGNIARNTTNIPYQRDISGENFTPGKPNSVPNGYVFDGWYTTAQGYDGSKYDFAGKTMPAYSLILYAHWVKPQHTVTFQPDNGEASFAQTVPALETITEPTPPTKPGFVFGGWYRQNSNLRYVFSFPVNSSFTLTARWIAENNITYDVVYMTGNVEYLRQSFGSNAVGDTVTASAITIPGYLPDYLSQSLTLAATGNEIVFRYTPFATVGYTVNYVDTNNVSLYPSKNASTNQASVTEDYVYLSGYSPNFYQQTLQLTPVAANNVITFVYTPNKDVEYFVRIFRENLGGSYTLYHEETKQAPAGSLATEAPPLYTGFDYQPSLSSNSRVVASNGSTILRLYYTRDLYTVDFTTDGNGSLSGQTSFASIQYETLFGNAVTVPIPVAEPGYKFDRWEPALPGAGDAITGSQTYTAYFVKDEDQWATVTLYGNGADTGDTFESEELLVGSEYTLPPNPFGLDHYDFTNWDTEQNGSGASYADKATFTVTGDLVLYAQWVHEVQFTITYLNNGATGAVSDTNPYDRDDLVTVLDASGFTYPGYTFQHWTDTENNIVNPGDQFNIESNVVLTAQWEKDPTQWVTIVYDKNNDDATGAMQNEEILVGEPHTLMPNQFTLANYTFDGWNTQKTGGAVYTDRDTITPAAGGELRLYAQWTEYDKFDITYDSNNGSGDEEMDTEVYASVPHTIYSADTFTYEHNDFVRWSTMPDGTGDTYIPGSSVLITGDLKLYAFWDEREMYTITYYDGFGTGSFSQQDYADADDLLDFTVADNPFYRLGYDFTAWKSNSNALAMPRAVILDINKDMSFTAQWDPIIYNITYELDGGFVNGVNPNCYTIETPSFELIDPTKPGYTFTGWTGSNLEQLTEDVIVGQSQVGDLSFTAHWVRDDSQWVTISFVSEDENKGTLEGRLSFEGVIGEGINSARIIDVAYPTLVAGKGYEFASWSEPMPTTFPEEDLIITAYWRLLDASSGTDGSSSGSDSSDDSGSSDGSGSSGPGASGGVNGSGSASDIDSSSASSNSVLGGNTRSPQTGDHASLWMWLPITLLAAGGLATLLVLTRQRSRKKYG